MALEIVELVKKEHWVAIYPEVVGENPAPRPCQGVTIVAPFFQGLDIIFNDAIIRLKRIMEVNF